MRQLYLFWLAAIALLGVSFNAHAADCTVEWNIPGAIELRSNLQSSATVTKLDGETTYSVKPSGRPYFFATEGYLITKVENTAGQTLMINTTSSGEKYVGFFCNPSYQGKTVKITVVKLSEIVKDKTFTLDIENGASYLAGITLDGIGENIELKNGIQTISYSSEITSYVRIAETNQQKIFSVKKDGTAVSKRYNWDTYYDVPLTDGVSVSVRVFEDQEPVSNVLTGTFTFEGLGKDALSMAFNTTAMKTITARDQFEFNSNDQIRLTFNIKDYVINLSCNGSPVTITEDGDRGVWLSPALTENTTFTINATEREYGNTDLYVAIHGDLSGVALTEGGYDGKVIDLSGITPSEVTKDGEKYSLYTIPVSLKSPKIFWTSKEGYWIHEKKTVASDGEGGYAEAGSVSADNCSKSSPAYVYVHKINKDKKAVVYVKGILSGFALKDARGNGYTLTEGYNDIEFDPIYNESFSIRPYKENENDDFSAYRNYTAISPDENGVYQTGLNNDDVLHIFSRVSPAQYVINVTRDDRTSAITLDKTRKVDPAAKDFEAFEGTEITVLPRTDSKFLLDGEVAASNTFTVSKAHSITLSYEGNQNEAVTDPADGSDAESLEFVTVTFPNATSVVRSALADDEMMFVAAGNSWAPSSTTIEAVVGAEKPTFKISFAPAPTEMKQYILDIPAGFFIVDNDLDSKQITATLTLKKTLTEMAYVIDPEGDTMVASEYGPMFTVIFEDGVQVPTLDAATIAEKVTIKFNDEKLEYDKSFTGGFIMISEGNMLQAQVPGAANKAGTLSIEIAAGLFKVGDLESPAISKTYQIIADKEFTYTITTPTEVNSRHSSLAEIIITFPDAETGTIFDEFGTASTLTNGSYGADRYYQNGTIEEVTASPEVRAAGGKQFKIKFNPAPKANGNYTLTVREGTFTLDGAYASAPISEELVLDSTVGVTEIGADNFENAIVISIDGKVLSNKADKAFIDNLDKGIYIINGKKYIKK